MRRMNLILRQLKRQIKKNLILAALIVQRFRDFKNRFKILDHCLEETVEFRAIKIRATLMQHFLLCSHLQDIPEYNEVQKVLR